jgi:hypothetical protein
MAQTASPETKLSKAVACKIHEGPGSYFFHIFTNRSKDTGVRLLLLRDLQLTLQN